MPIVFTLVVGEGVRIDATDIWMLKDIIDDGTAAIFITPTGLEVVIRQNINFRVGPGFRMSLAPGADPGQVRLSMEAYIPLMHRHPPRNHKPPHPVGTSHPGHRHPPADTAGAERKPRE